MVALGVLSVIVTWTDELKDSLPGLMTGAAVCCCPFKGPYTLTWYSADTYTLPLTTVGTTNFTAGPGLSRPRFWSLE